MLQGTAPVIRGGDILALALPGHPQSARIGRETQLTITRIGEPTVSGYLGVQAVYSGAVQLEYADGRKRGRFFSVDAQLTAGSPRITKPVLPDNTLVGVVNFALDLDARSVTATARWRTGVGQLKREVKRADLQFPVRGMASGTRSIRCDSRRAPYDAERVRHGRRPSTA